MITARTRMRALRVGCVLAAILAAGGCASGHTARPSPEATFLVVRHAEKATDPGSPRDPPLSAAGEARARALATRLSATPLVAVYATPWRRTRDTAAAAAAAHRLAVRSEDPPDDATAYARTLRARHRAGTVLIVGHSNTVPALVAALCDCDAPALGDADYGDLFLIEPVANGSGRWRLQRQRFGQ